MKNIIIEQTEEDLKNIVRTTSDHILRILLTDQTTKTGLIWGTDNYGYEPSSSMDLEKVRTNDIIPRVFKNKEIQKKRTKQKAECFTPISIVKKMNDDFDKDFKGTFEDYIGRTQLEVCCGEAPFCVNRYDTVSGEWMDIPDRVGLLDRKLKKVSEQCHNEKDWLKYAIGSLTTSYGYEWQGDSLLLARLNVLWTMNDYYKVRFGRDLKDNLMVWFAYIITGNFIQMDGLTMNIPMTDTPAGSVKWNWGGEPTLILFKDADDNTGTKTYLASI